MIIDILLAIVFIVFIYLGFNYGFFRFLLILGSLWGGLIIAAIFEQSFVINVFNRVSPQSDANIKDTISFFTLWIILFSVLVYMGFHFFRFVELPFGWLDQLLGILTSTLVGITILIILTILMADLVPFMSCLSSTSAAHPIYATFFVDQAEKSFLMPLVGNTFLPMLQNLVRPTLIMVENPNSTFIMRFQYAPFQGNPCS